MEKNQSSETAKGVAAYRMIESIRPKKDRVIYDPYAELFLDKKWIKWIRNPIQVLFLKFLGNIKFPGFRGSVIARVRFMNECIKECFPNHFNQLVILGAGYDMSAYCFRDILADANVFEVDHPSTQIEKLSRIQNQVDQIFENITYVSVNFETDDLKNSLLTRGYSPSQKTLFIWEGVIHYLDKESVEKTLDFVVENSAKGSKLAFDFFPPEVIDGSSSDRLSKAMQKLVSKVGEPYKFGIEVDSVEKFLKNHGFTKIHQTCSSEVKNTYFHGNNKNRKISDLFNFVCATT